jgi:hypothetical protein
MAAPTKATATKHTTRPTSNAKILQKVLDLETRVETLESAINTAKLQQQRAAAAKLAANPEQLAQLKALIDLASETQPQK